LDSTAFRPQAQMCSNSITTFCCARVSNLGDRELDNNGFVGHQLLKLATPEITKQLKSAIRAMIKAGSKEMIQAPVWRPHQ
jgi:hypothetical protein